MNFELIFDEIEIIRNCIRNEIPYSDTGKLIRSGLGSLLIKGYNIEFCEELKNVLIAVELMHNASLLHDDVIDNASQRRGESACNIKNNNSIAVLTGDLLFAKSMEYIRNIKSYEIFNIFNKTMINMCKGELKQLNNKWKIPDIDSYIHICELKTAALFLTVFNAISILSEDKIPNDIVNFAKYFGIAYQIKNDLQDATDKQKDIENGIYTAPVIFSGGTDITKAAIEKTSGLIDNYSRKAITSLKLMSDSCYKKELIRIAQCLNE